MVISLLLPSPHRPAQDHRLPHFTCRRRSNFNKIRAVCMTTLEANAVSIATPTALGPKECNGLDYDVARGAEPRIQHLSSTWVLIMRSKKTEGWTAASRTLREQRPHHLDLVYGNGERNR